MCGIFPLCPLNFLPSQILSPALLYHTLSFPFISAYTISNLKPFWHGAGSKDPKIFTTLIAFKRVKVLVSNFFSWISKTKNLYRIKTQIFTPPPLERGTKKMIFKYGLRAQVAKLIFKAYRKRTISKQKVLLLLKHIIEQDLPNDYKIMKVPGKER